MFSYFDDTTEVADAVGASTEVSVCKSSSEVRTRKERPDSSFLSFFTGQGSRDGKIARLLATMTESRED